jgi:hypothetical protein
VLVVLLLLNACAAKNDAPVCGLHSAAAPVVSKLNGKERHLTVGAKLKPSDHLKATGDALIECFGGALRRVEKGDTFDVGDLIEAKIESTNVPRFRLADGKLQPVEAMRRTIIARYSDNHFTPESALTPNEPTTDDYLVAFFTPNGFAKMRPPNLEGPKRLEAPPMRAKVPYVHAGDLGEGRYLLTVDDEVAFAETDDLATAVLLEDQTYALGRTVRLILPKGAEATLDLGNNQTLALEGPLDLALR